MGHCNHQESVNTSSRNQSPAPLSFKILEKRDQKSEKNRRLSYMNSKNPKKAEMSSERRDKGNLTNRKNLNLRCNQVQAANIMKKTIVVSSKRQGSTPRGVTPSFQNFKNFKKSHKNSRNSRITSRNDSIASISRQTSFRNDDRESSVSSRISIKDKKTTNRRLGSSLSAKFEPKALLKNYKRIFSKINNLSSKDKLKRISFKFMDLCPGILTSDIQLLKNSLYVLTFYLKVTKMITKSSKSMDEGSLSTFISEIKSRKFKSVCKRGDKYLKVFVFLLENIQKSRLIGEKDAMKYLIKFLSDEEAFNLNGMNIILELVQQRLGKIMGLGFVFKGMIEEVIFKAKKFIEIFEKEQSGVEHMQPIDILDAYFKLASESVSQNFNVVYLLDEDKQRYCEYENLESSAEDHIITVVDLRSMKYTLDIDILVSKNLKQKVNFAKSQPSSSVPTTPRGKQGNQEIKIEYLNSHSPLQRKEGTSSMRQNDVRSITPLTQKVNQGYFLHTNQSGFTPYKASPVEHNRSQNKKRTRRKKSKLSGYSFSPLNRDLSTESNKSRCQYYKNLKNSSKNNSSKSSKVSKNRYNAVNIRNFRVNSEYEKMKKLENELNNSNTEKSIISTRRPLGSKNMNMEQNCKSRGRNNILKNQRFLRPDRKSVSPATNSNRNKGNEAVVNRKRNPRDNKENILRHPLSLRPDQNDLMRQERYFGSRNSSKNSKKSIPKNYTKYARISDKSMQRAQDPPINREFVYETPKNKFDGTSLDKRELKKFSKSDLKKKIEEVNQKIRDNFSSIKMDNFLNQIEVGKIANNQNMSNHPRHSKSRRLGDYCGIKGAMSDINDLLFYMSKDSFYFKRMEKR